jgi:hypothetical protein
MANWLYTLRERLTSAMKESFDSCKLFSGFAHITELVTLDSMMCPDIITELTAEDWDHNVHDDCRINLFRDAEYSLTRQPLDASRHQLIAALENPNAIDPVPTGFVLCGHDIMDSYFGNSTLTNRGPITEAFSPSDVNQYGLIDDRDQAFSIRDTMRKLQPDDPHLGACEVWLLARRLPDGCEPAC